MAKKVSNINLPDGTTVTIPTWASESTMEQAVNYMSATNKVDQKFLTLMKGLGTDVSGLQKSISSLVQPVKQNAKNDREAKKDDIDLAKGIKGTARSIMKASSFFGKTDAPLSGMVGAAEQLTDKFRTAMPGFLNQHIQSGSRLSTALNYFGAAADVATDAVLAFAGWNAAKLEQFAEAQQKIIDAGAIYYSSGEQFDLLYSNSLDAGVTYNAMIDTVSQFGGAMTALGGSVSAGTVNFIDMFDRLNETADAFGDLGLSSKDMMGQYAEFLEYSRLTGTLNRGLVDNGEALNRSFINLQIESAGLANLTALSKSEAMRRQMDALTQPLVVLGTSSLEERGFPGSAEVVRGITARLGLIAPDNEVFQMIMDGFAQEVAETTDPANFDLAKRLDPSFRGALEAIVPNLIDNINGMVRAGSVSAEQAGDMLFESLSNADMTSIQTAGAVAGSTLKYMTEIQAAIYKYNLDFQALNNMSESEREEYRRQLEDNMGESGRSVQMMNEVTEQFLQLQDAMTLPMQQTYQVFDDISDMLSGSADRIREFFGIEDDSGFGDYMDPMVNTGPPTVPFYPPSSGGGGGGGGGGHPPTRTPRPVGEVPGEHQIDPNLDEDLANLLTSVADDFGLVMGNRSGLREFNPATGEDTAGSTSGRHTGGYAMDVELYEDGRLLSMNNPGDIALIRDFTRAFMEDAIAAGHQPSIGWGANYMGGTAGHFDIAAGHINPSNGAPIAQAFWGDGTRSANAPGWLRDLFTELVPRRMGGPVDPNKPYLVGDQLGMNTAELFVPETAGNIINNRDLNTMISNLVSGQGDLTSGGSGAIIEELRQEYLSLIESKSQTVRTMTALREAIRLFNDNKNRKARIDIINSV